VERSNCLPRRTPRSPFHNFCPGNIGGEYHRRHRLGVDSFRILVPRNPNHRRYICLALSHGYLRVEIESRCEYAIRKAPRDISRKIRGGKWRQNQRFIYHDILNLLDDENSIVLLTRNSKFPKWKLAQRISDSCSNGFVDLRDFAKARTLL
jgi:hypothetical protein